MDAIESDELGRAKINYDKCVSCGMCLVNCPFAAIADKLEKQLGLATIGMMPVQSYDLSREHKNGKEGK